MSGDQPLSSSRGAERQCFLPMARGRGQGWKLTWTSGSNPRRSDSSWTMAVLLDEVAQWMGRRPSVSFVEVCLGDSFAIVSDDVDTAEDTPKWARRD